MIYKNNALLQFNLLDIGRKIFLHSSMESNQAPYNKYGCTDRIGHNNSLHIFRPCGAGSHGSPREAKSENLL